MSGPSALTVSACIITRNEADGIAACLESAAWADEIIVTDSGSTDGTPDICRRFTPDVLTRDWTGYADQKNFCLSKARGDWILSLDADERVTPALRDEIRSEIRTTPWERSGYWIPRRNYLGDVWIRHGGWHPDYQLRLFRRGRGSFRSKRVHEAVNLNGGTGHLRQPIEHRSFRDLADFHDRIRFYAALAAEDLRERGVRLPRLQGFLRAPAALIKAYVLRGGFLDGRLGWAMARGRMLETWWKFQETARRPVPVPDAR
ncbi:MAG: glycosyltransferase family 2 protein [Planctomycetota bacterium]